AAAAAHADGRGTAPAPDGGGSSRGRPVACRRRSGRTQRADRAGSDRPAWAHPSGGPERGLDLGGLQVIDVKHSHAAAARACELAAKGEASAIMKGALHTDELLEAIVSSNSGLRTDRRMSHVFVLDVPTYPRPLLVSDAALNIAPDLAAKRDIGQNAIDCAQAMDIAEPKVAILSAVETVNPKMISTVDAAALCKMAERGQIVGGKLDGPLAFDNAISLEAAQAKGIR